MHSWDPLSPWFSTSDKLSPTAGGDPTPATIFPLLGEDLVNNHISLGVPPLNTDMQTPCQVEVIPRKSEGIEPFTLVNSLPGQVEVLSSHLINTPSGQVEDPSLHMVNSPPCQVRVTPRNPGGIEPSTLVNSPPGQVGAAPSQLINTQSVPHKVTSSVSSWVPFSTSHIVAPVSLLLSSTSVLVPITDIAPPVTSPMSCTVPASASDCVTPVPPPSPSVPVSNPITHGTPPIISPPCSLAS